MGTEPRTSYGPRMTAHDFDDVLAFWLGELDGEGCASDESSARWWKKSDAFDAEIRERFGPVHQAICEDGCLAWLASPEGRVAYVIVLDQLSRNMLRGDPSMYDQDGRAQRVALEGIDAGCDAALGYHARYFLYMPLMHAEDLALQDRCVALFESMNAAFPKKAADVTRAVGYAVKHRDIVARFSRFPHRNAILGRPSTEHEIEFLKGPGSSF